MSRNAMKRIDWPLSALLLVLTACAGVYGSPDRAASLEKLQADCPEYYASSTEHQRTNVVNKVVVPNYPECVVRHLLGEPAARKPDAADPGSELWFYDRDPGYLQLTIANGRLSTWSRCGPCKRWYKD